MGQFVNKSTNEKLDIKPQGIFKSSKKVGKWLQKYSMIQLKDSTLKWKKEKKGYCYYKETKDKKNVADWFPCDNSHLGTFKIEYEDDYDDEGICMLYDFDDRKVYNDG